MAKLKRALKRPADPIRLAKLVGDIATGQIKDEVEDRPTPDEIRRVMSALGKIGGPMGGKARAKSLTPEQRSEIARVAAVSRWKSKRSSK